MYVHSLDIGEVLVEVLLSDHGDHRGHVALEKVPRLLTVEGIAIRGLQDSNCFSNGLQLKEELVYSEECSSREY